jgi:hypothetical protein
MTGPRVGAPRPRRAAGAVYVTPGWRLRGNTVVLAALEPAAEVAPAGGAATTTPGVSSGGVAVPSKRPAGKLGSIVLFPTGGSVPAAGATAVSKGNPYSFYQSIGACAADQRARCVSCLPEGSCVPVTDMTDGNTECSQLGANGERGFSLVCINLALAIDAVASCTAERAPSCPQDVRASESFASLENNARFFDDGACGQPLDACLLKVFGDSPDPTPPPPLPSDPAPACDPDGCDSDPGCDDACSGETTCEGDDGSSCDSGGDCGGSEGGGCGDGEDACGGGENSACSEGDCGSEGGGCDGGGEGCEGGGGGCEGGEGCEGGGGDCGGGGGGCSDGGDCSTGKRKHRSHGTLIAVLWALLPVPFAAFIRRRSRKQCAAREAANADETHAAKGEAVASSDLSDFERDASKGEADASSDNERDASKGEADAGSDNERDASKGETDASSDLAGADDDSRCEASAGGDDDSRREASDGNDDDARREASDGARRKASDDDARREASDGNDDDARRKASDDDSRREARANDDESEVSS